MPSMAGNLTGVIVFDDISAWLCKSWGIWGHFEAQVLPVVPKLFPWHVFYIPRWYCPQTHWETHSSNAMLIRLTSNGLHHFLNQQIWTSMSFYGKSPGVQSTKWISTSFIPQSFPSSMKGKHPITYSPELVRQHSVRDWTSSEGWSYFVIRHLMFRHCLKFPVHKKKNIYFQRQQLET